jgi:hypothetical protein
MPVAIESTTLASVAYDETRRLLQLEFCSQAVYVYFGVPASVHQALLSASSKGRYFNQTIRGRFPYRLVRSWETTQLDVKLQAECDR